MALDAVGYEATQAQCWLKCQPSSYEARGLWLFGVIRGGIGSTRRLGAAWQQHTAPSKELQACSLCGLGFDWDKYVAELFSLPFEFCFEPFLPLGISGGPDALLIFDLIFDHGVKDHCDLVGGCHGGTFWAELGFHSAQVVA